MWVWCKGSRWCWVIVAQTAAWVSGVWCSYHLLLWACAGGWPGGDKCAECRSHCVVGGIQCSMAVNDLLGIQPKLLQNALATSCVIGETCQKSPFSQNVLIQHEIIILCVCHVSAPISNAFHFRFLPICSCLNSSIWVYSQFSYFSSFANLYDGFLA